MSIVAIIPARGNSKGIPRKNLVSVCGRPLLAYTVEAALEAPSIDRVIVSSDDADIRSIARRMGAEAIVRPEALSGDEASSEAALLHVADELREQGGEEPDVIVFLQATSPVRGPSDIEDAIQLFLRESADSLFSSCPVQGFVWQQRRDELSSVTYDHRDRRMRQDLAEVLMENGSIYVMRTKMLRESGNRLGGKIVQFPMDPLHSYQIDEPEDIERIETLVALYPRAPRPEALQEIRLLVLDFDGVLTDNRVRVDEKGEEAVLCHRGDGLGLERLKRSGVDVVVISKEKNPVVRERCRKLGVACYQACDDKLSVLQSLRESRDLGWEQIAYIGNDINDGECLERVGCGVVVADAEPAVRASASYRTSRRGGHGAVREVADWIVESQALGSCRAR